MISFNKLLVIAAVCVVNQFATGQQQLVSNPNLEWNVNLTKCCEEEPFFALGFDSCKTGDIPVVWPPPVYLVKLNRTVDPKNIEFSLLTNLSTCPDGYTSLSTTDFHLHVDGTVTLANGNQLNSNEFCLNQILEDPTTREADFAVRFCVPDPCNQTNCVHKCCPNGMALNETSKLCQTTKEPFSLVFHNESGHETTPSPGSYIIRDGNVPLCPYGMYSLTPQVNKEEFFYVLPDGQIYVPGYPENERASKEYCIEDFILETGIARQALMCFPPQPEESADNQLVLKVFPYFLFLSSIFLVATFVVYAMIPEIRNIHGVTIMCHVASLAVTYIGLGIIQLNTLMADGLCMGIAVVVHFAFLSTFTWLNVMSFDIWWTFSDLRPRNSRHGRQHLGRRIIFYSIYAWGVPFAIVVVGQILDNVKNLPSNVIKPGFGEVKCWFYDRGSFLVYLYGPIAVLILSNIVFFIMTAVLLYRASIDAAFAVNSAHAKQKFRVIFSLFILMGVSWMMEVISFAVGGSAYIWIPTDILNILTGVFIFVIFVCKPNVWKLLKAKCPCLERLDRCCPSFMTRSNTRQGTTTRSTRNEVSVTKSLNNHHPSTGNNISDDSKKRISMATATQSTQLRDSSQIDSGDEMILDHESARMN